MNDLKYTSLASERVEVSCLMLTAFAFAGKQLESQTMFDENHQTHSVEYEVLKAKLRV